MATSNPASQTILFLTANPKGTAPLRLDQELRDIGEGLQRAQKRDQFNLEQRSAVRPRDIQRAMLDLSPQIVHFSGHGAGEVGLVFEDDVGNAKMVDGDALAHLFDLFADKLNCVVLNGCYSELQAQAIAQYIPYVIGMNKAIGDKAAITFAVGFYDALGAGRDVEFAFKLGCAAIRLEGIDEHLTPILIKKPGAAENKVSAHSTSQLIPSDEEKSIDSIPTMPPTQPGQTDMSQTNTDSSTGWQINVGGGGTVNITPPSMEQSDFVPPEPRKGERTKINLRSGLLISLFATVGISIARFSGVLQPLELQAYDFVMRSRHLSEGQDDHILVIKVIAQDEPDRENRLNTLSDERLDKLLALLKQYEPSVIGFDNFLNHKIDLKHENIQEGLQSGSLVVVCQAKENDPASFKAPEGAISVGFGDITVDSDKIVRRQLLQMKLQTAACSKSNALSALLAHYYIKDNSQSMELPFQGNYGQLGNKKIGFLSNYTGGYQQFALINRNDNQGYQVMLNYRHAHSLLDGFSSISINEIFKLLPSELTAKIKDRIILIGTTESAIHQDIHKTPYGETIPGVFLQAQMTSQLVNAALHNRPLIWAYPVWGEMLLIWLAAGAGWPVATRVRNRWILVGLNGLVIVILFVGSVILLTAAGYWFPLLPTGLSFGLGCSSVTIYQLIGTKLKRLRQNL